MSYVSERHDCRAISPHCCGQVLLQTRPTQGSQQSGCYCHGQTGVSVIPSLVYWYHTTAAGVAWLCSPPVPRGIKADILLWIISRPSQAVIIVSGDITRNFYVLCELQYSSNILSFRNKWFSLHELWIIRKTWYYLGFFNFDCEDYVNVIIIIPLSNFQIWHF